MAKFLDNSGLSYFVDKLKSKFVTQSEYGLPIYYVETGDAPSGGNYQTKSVTPTESAQTITADSGYDALEQVNVGAISNTFVGSGITRQSAATITPSTSSQVAVAADRYTTGAVTVDPIPSQYIVPSGSQTITENGTYDVADKASVVVDVESSSGQTTTVVIPEQTISASSSYTQIPTVVEALIEGEEYIYTVNGVSGTGTAISQYGSILLYTSDRRIIFDNSSEVMYFDVEESSLYGSYTIKVEKITSSGGGGSSTLITKTITANGTYAASDDNADGYSSVTVNVSGSSKNVQSAQSTTRATSTSYTELVTLTCSVTGTYTVKWSTFRTSTSGTWGSQLYIDDVAYGSAQTGSWSNHIQNITLTGVSITAGQEVSVRVRSRGSNYYGYVGTLVIEQTA